jgi:hypothetical protein
VKPLALGHGLGNFMPPEIGPASTARALVSVVAPETPSWGDKISTKMHSSAFIESAVSYLF